MLCVNAPPKKAQEGGGSEVFQELKGICIALGMSKPPANITMFQFFSGIEKKVRIESQYYSGLNPNAILFAHGVCGGKCQLHFDPSMSFATPIF